MLGEVLGSYRILRQIGAGGMGVVYYAQHQLIGRRAAVKVLLPQYSRDASMINRFFNEARTTTLIQHPGLVDIFDFGFHPSGAAYLVMEFLEGETLGAKRKREGRLPAWMVDALIRQVASAVGAAHRAGIVHRDLKPDNIFLVPDRNAPAHLRVKVLDFGVAKLNAELGAGSNTSVSSMLGTPQYMSPEQCRGAGQVDHRTDIYAIGCIMFELLTGRPVFQGRGFGEILAAHQRLSPPSLLAFDPSLPPDLDRLVQMLLAKRPEDRLQSLEDLEAALENLAIAFGWEAFYSRRTGSVPMIPIQGLTSSQQRMFVSQGGGGSGPAPPVQATTTLGSAAAEVQEPAPAPAEPPRPRRGRWLLPAIVVAGAAAGIAVAVVHGGGGGGAGTPTAASTPWAQSSAPLPTPLPVAVPPDAAPRVAASPPDAAPAKITLRIDSEPPNADVFRGDERIGSTPLALDEVKRAGEETFVVRMADHDDATIHMSTDHDGHEQVKLAARAPPPPPPEATTTPPPTPTSAPARPKPAPAPAPAPKKRKPAIEL